MEVLIFILYIENQSTLGLITRYTNSNWAIREVENGAKIYGRV